MIENIKYLLFITLYPIFLFISNVFNYILDLLVHPLRNISFWAFILLICFIYKNDVTELGGKEMFLFSVGLVTILTFIVTYLESHTVDLNKKENYYLGYNLKKQNLYNNFWLKRFNEVPIKLFLWILASFPVIKMAVKYKYNIEIVEIIKVFLKDNNNYMYSIWLSVVIVICFYCAAILIESVCLSRSSFVRSRLYDSKNWIAKYKIKREIEEQFKSEFKNLFNRVKHDELKMKSKEITNFIFKRAGDVTSNEKEFMDYIEIVYLQEDDVISTIFEKIETAIKSINEDSCIRVLKKIRIYILKKRLEKLKWYYYGKWNWIDNSNIIPPIFLLIANYDLTRLLNLESKFNSSEKELFQIYREVFWGVYYNNQFYSENNDMKKEENICFAKIVDITRERFKDCNFYQDLNDLNNLYNIFKTLNQFNYVAGNTIYLSNIFKVTFECLLDSLKDENLKNKSKFLSDFREKLTLQYYDKFLLEEATKYSYKKMMSGSKISNNEIEYLLNFMDLKNIITSLIFRLAYNERTHRNIISVDEFKFWKLRIRELNYDETNNIEYLKKQNYANDLCKGIKQSDVSHFIFDDFLIWMWESLFTDFDSKKYNEFQKLGDDGIRRNFSLDSYIILRILLLQNKYYRFSIDNFTDKEKRDIEKELALIQDILKKENII